MPHVVHSCPKIRTASSRERFEVALVVVVLVGATAVLAEGHTTGVLLWCSVMSHFGPTGSYVVMTY